MRRWIPWVLVLVLVVVGGLFLARWVIAQVEAGSLAGNPVAGKPTPTAPPGAIISEQRLFDPNLDLQSRESLNEKLEIEALKATQKAAGEANPAPKDKLPPAPTVVNQAVANPPAPSGIYNGSEGMVKPEQAQINNYWQGAFNGKALMVMAGSEPVDTSKGLVIVVSSDGFSVTGFEIVLAPQGVGSLKVVEATGAILTLEDQSGNRLTFDLASQAFIP